MGVQAKDMKHQACLVWTEGVLIPPASQPEPHNPVRACPSPGTLPGEDPQRLLEEEVAGGQAGQPLGPLGAASDRKRPPFCQLQARCQGVSCTISLESRVS